MSAFTLELCDLFAGNLARFGSRPALVFRGESMSYRELDRRVNEFVERLALLGAGPNSRIAIAMDNRPEFVIADLAVLLLRATKVPVSNMLSEQEIAAILVDSEADIIVCDERLLGLLYPAPQARVIVVAGQITGDAATDPRVFPLEATATDHVPARLSAAQDDSGLGVIYYTGGTTGAPKGVAHTRSALALNLLSHVTEMNLQDDERILVTTPLAHAAGLVAQSGLYKGATIYIEQSFTVDAVIDEVQAHGITFLFMVPTMIYRILDRLRERLDDLPSIRTILYGAAPMSPERLTQGLALFGPVFMQLYGQSEAPNFLTRLRREDHDLDRAHLLTSCGQAVPLMQVGIQDEEGNPVASGNVGEIVARGPYVMDRYLNLPGKTADALRGGWLHTGDLGRMDEDGYVYLLDRKNDLIITGGMNVYSTEVENALQGCDGVKQLAVVGVPDPDWGEKVVAFVVPTHAETFDASALRVHVESTLARYKQPKAVQILAELPLTMYGKVDKKRLRELWRG